VGFNLDWLGLALVLALLLPVCDVQVGIIWTHALGGS